MRIAAAVLMLCAPCMAVADADHCAGLIPQSIEAAVAKKYPAYRLPKSSDNLAEDVKYNIENNGMGCLGVDKGDYDGDGATDYLLGLSALKGNGAVIVVALRHGNDWQIEELAKWPNSRNRLFVETLKPGKYESILDYEQDSPAKEPGEALKFNCRQYVAAFGETEASEVAYCRTPKGWRHTWISD